MPSEEPAPAAVAAAPAEGGFVKKLLFPAYTHQDADAGANDSAQEPQPADPSVAESLNLLRFSSQQAPAAGPPASASSCASTHSEASTAIRDNRTIVHLTYPPFKQQRKATGAAAAASAVADDANRANKMNAPSSSSSTQQQQQQQQQQPPSFFASTKPKQKINAKQSPHDVPLLPPASPPKVPRVPLQNRSLSTTAVVSSDIDVHPTTTHFPFLDTEDVLSEKSQETVYQDAAGIAIVPAASSNHTGTATSPTSTRPFAARFLRNRSNATTAQDRNDSIEVMNDVDNDSRGGSSSSSTSGPPVQDRSILDTMSTNSDSKGDGDNHNNDPHHHVLPPSAAAAAAAATPAWEEEATPAQTAFGKRLLFQRVARHPAAEEDALSTTSEQGTVINHDQRLAEMSTDADAYDIHENDDDNDDEDNRDNDLIPPCASSTSTRLYTTPPQEEEEVWDEERSNLAMPVLESGGPNNPIASAKAVVGSPVRISRPKQMDEDERRDNGLEDSTTAEANQTGHAAATGILSMAIRRLGSGFSGNTNNANNHQSLSRNTMSAPTTPQPYRNNSHTSAHQSPVDGYLQQQQQPQSWISTPRSSLHAEEGPTASFPSSFLLRSPGSSAFQNAASAKKAAAAAVASNNNSSSSSQPQLAPRFSSWQGNAVRRHRPFDKIPEEEVAGRGKSDNESGMRSSSTNGNGNNNLKAFQIARSCFSFDAFDTSMDEQYEFSIPNHQYYGSSAGDQQQHHHHQKVPYMEHTSSSPFRQPQAQRTAAAAEVMRSRQTSGGGGLTTSASWDAGSTSNNNSHHRTAAAAFRPRPGDRSCNGGFARILRPPASNQMSSPSSRRKYNNNNSNVESHSRMMTSDFSPSSNVMNQGETQQLKTPQRIEIEREDALDILACLVERGVSWKCDSLTVSGETGAQVGGGSSENAVGEKGDISDSPPPRSQTPSVSEITTVVRELQELSLAEERLGDFHNNSEAHKKRKLALEELLRSHAYALEMQRASQSASSWLQSIDRSQSASSSPQKQTLPGKTVLERAPDSPPSTDTTTTTGSSQQAAGEESSASENMDLLTAKALLHTSQMELKEKKELADRLNEELAQCREEIGRLKTASQAAVFRSPNRSILDESDDISVTEAEEEEEEEIDVLERSFESVPSVGNDNVDTSFLREGEKDSEENRQAPASGVTELEKFKAALDDANGVIRKLHSKLKLMEDENDGNKGEFADPPLIQVPSSDDLLETQKPVSPGNKEKHTVSVHMLDGENFITDWDGLAASMPGPPDHELRSPIVASILEAWTSDRNLHESLVAWMDQILEGGDPDSVPPLTLSNLGHQVRDGFTLHVLPLLFRRPDIRVDVKSRVHRRTTYDLSVTVDSLPGRQLSQDMRRTLSGSSATNSLATTALVNNSARGYDGTTNGHEDSVTPTANAQAASSRLSYDEVTEDIASPDDAQPGIMSTLGGALGGLLTRRSKGPNQESLPPEGPPSNMEMILESPSSAGLASEIVGLAEGDDDQPYHRVVSAPPGRIGVTFVEYRGHCMVSDVNPDSPLIGWIYPSDVLIAIDELPVSGMRVRDIITVLKDRTEKQRALRVVSSHAMNEFTLNASAVVDETG